MLYEIVPGLYLSNYPSARDSRLSPNTLVVNCTKNLPMVKCGGVRLAVNDDLQPESIQGMTKSLPVIVPYIDKAITVYRRPVLVHCAAGQQRSAAVVAAYLVYKYNYTIYQAIQIVKSKKPDAFLTGVNFENSLKDYYSYLHKNGNRRR